MPFIRYTYGPDIAKFGDKPIRVEDVEVRVLTEMRRAVEVSPAELEELTKPELAEIADQVGAEVKSRDPKGQFVKKIAEAEGK